MEDISNLNMLENRANNNPLTITRLADWVRIIKWEVGENDYFWTTKERKISKIQRSNPDIILKCSAETLERIALGKLPFFIGIWGTGEIQFEGIFADAYRLGYLFLSDKRRRRVIFVSHCWLNINTRFPEGCTFEGADIPIVQTLLADGLGLIQMPCPEYECLGLEKELYGEVANEQLRSCFRNTAQKVVKQIKDYLASGYEIVGVIGMNPSPSCGIGVAKGKGTMLGIDRDTSEKNESGVFIEELEKLLKENKIEGINVFGIRRHSEEETKNNERLIDLKYQISKSI